MRCSRHGAQLMGASGARCRGKACHGVANDAVATTNERRRHGRRALGRQSRAPCCHNAKPRRGVCPNSVQTRIQCESPGRSSLLSCCSCRSAHAISRRTCSNMLSAGSGRARSAPARNGGRRPSHPTAAGHSAAVADALEDEGWPGCQGSRASATGYDRALLALSRVLNPTTRATRRHTASMRTFDESLAWPLRTLRSA